jgi:hypothetical protein
LANLNLSDKPEAAIVLFVGGELGTTRVNSTLISSHLLKHTARLHQLEPMLPDNEAERTKVA